MVSLKLVDGCKKETTSESEQIFSVFLTYVLKTHADLRNFHIHTISSYAPTYIGSTDIAVLHMQLKVYFQHILKIYSL